MCSFLCLYTSPSKTRDIFETFADNFELTLDTIIKKNQFLIVALGDFNAKTTNWYKNDINSYESLKIDTITSQFRLQQLINELTHLTTNSSSCIDPIFTSQPNLVMECGVHSSLHPNCHHQIVFAKINLKIRYPPPYGREIWHYEKANADLIRRSIDQFSWDNRFSNMDVNRKVHLFNQTIKSILCNFIPHETVTYDDRDLVENTSKLPTDSFKRTNNLLSATSFNKDDIAKIIKNLNPNKAHGFDMISIRMLKICDSILKPLELIFKSSIESGNIPIEWKKVNVALVHKKNNKQLIESYGPISLAPVCGKTVERLIYNKMFEFFTENELISHNQSGLKPGHLWINQLLCITYNIYQSLDDGLEASFLIYERHLIKFGTRVFSSH